MSFEYNAFWNLQSHLSFEMLVHLGTFSNFSPQPQGLETPALLNERRHFLMVTSFQEWRL